MEKQLTVINTCIEISPCELYPTETIESLSNAKLQRYRNLYKNNVEVEPIQVILFEEHYYIVNGHHRVLAAIMNNTNKIKVEVITKENDIFYRYMGYIKELIGTVGVRTLYDFESIGNFTYMEYPVYYFN